jgi:hypothetical protein
MTKEQIEKGNKLIKKIEALEKIISDSRTAYNLAKKDNRVPFISFGTGRDYGSGYMTFSLPFEKNFIDKLYNLFLSEAQAELKKLNKEFEEL